MHHEPDPERSRPDELVVLLEALRADLDARAASLREGANVPSGGISFGKRSVKAPASPSNDSPMLRFTIRSFTNWRR